MVVAIHTDWKRKNKQTKEPEKRQIKLTLYIPSLLVGNKVHFKRVKNEL